MVIDGRKTETRRRVKPDENLCRYRPGRDYAVQAKRGGRSIMRILIDQVARERLRDLDDEAATREGFADRAGFEAYWRELHGSFDDTIEVWAIRFQRVWPCIFCERLTPLLFSIDLNVAPFPACDSFHADLATY